MSAPGTMRVIAHITNESQKVLKRAWPALLSALAVLLVAYAERRHALKEFGKRKSHGNPRRPIAVNSPSLISFTRVRTSPNRRGPHLPTRSARE
jgi:hypothetical protein